MRTQRNRAAATVALAVALLVAGGAAFAFVTSSGSGAGSASSGTLGAPSGVTASAAAGTVSLTWTAAVPPAGQSLTGYHVQRSSGAPAGTCASSASSLLASTATNCSDTGVPTGSHTYTIVAVFRTWTASAASNAVVVVATVLDHFVVTAPASAVAGGPINVTVTAKDATDATLTSYAGDRTLAWSGAGSAPNGSTPAYPPSVTFSGGVGTAAVTLVKAETTTLTASEGAISGTSVGIMVSSGAASRFVVTAPTQQTAGTAFNVTLAAQDIFGNVADGYSGARTITWSGAGAAPNGATPTSTTSVNFTAGTGSVSVTLVKAGATTLTATQGTVTGSSPSIVVNPGTAARLGWTHVSVNRGTLSSTCVFTCTASDINNNGTFTAKVAVTDAVGNTVSGLGAGHTVTVSTPSSGPGSGGAFTAPTAGTSLTLTIAGAGAAESTATLTFTTQNGSWTSDTFKAAKLAGTAYPDATATVTK